ncbi:MAG: ribbon-helix-helix domain-containing protein [Pseudomonadota bacterium]
MNVLSKRTTLTQVDSPIESAIQTVEGGSEARIRVLQLAHRRTSVRLEDEFQQALEWIAKKEGLKYMELVREISRVKKPELSLTRALRVFTVEYLLGKVSQPHRRSRSRKTSSGPYL